MIFKETIFQTKIKWLSFRAWKSCVRCRAFTTRQKNQQKELKTCPKTISCGACIVATLYYFLNVVNSYRLVIYGLSSRLDCRNILVVVTFLLNSNRIASIGVRQIFGQALKVFPSITWISSCGSDRLLLVMSV